MEAFQCDRCKQYFAHGEEIRGTVKIMSKNKEGAICAFKIKLSYFSGRMIDLCPDCADSLSDWWNEIES